MRLLVCDMAGTIINERGIVYKSLLNTLENIGIKNELVWWYGLEKKEVINKSVDKFYNGDDIDSKKEELFTEFKERLDEEYFDSKSNICLIDEKIPDYFTELRKNGFKVALNTGYNKKIQEKLIDKLNLGNYIDDYISSEEVVAGRPYPYMIDELIKRNGIKIPGDVIKVGDTRNDIVEGRNARCGLKVGVLSGSGTRYDLIGADEVYKKITDLDLLSRPLDSIKRQPY